MAFDSDTLSSLVAECRQIARRAGQAILEVAAAGIDVETKGDGSPLTRADKAADEIIVTGLKTLEPKLPILSEEGDIESSDVSRWEVFWCVDPLDGTKEFIKGFGEYTVNIAIIEHAHPILGVVYVPTQDVMYYGAEGAGAWKISSGGEPVRISASECERPVRAVVSRSHLSDETKDFLSRLGITQTAPRGSSIKICAVAEGAADVYPRHGPTCLWDTAAGAAVAIEAGCSVLDLHGNSLSYDPSAGIKRPGFIVLPSRLASLVAGSAS